MKIGEIHVADLVAVNELPDCQLYTVKGFINVWVAELCYYTSAGKECSVSPLDISCLFKPTKEQLENHRDKD